MRFIYLVTLFCSIFLACKSDFKTSEKPEANTNNNSKTTSGNLFGSWVINASTDSSGLISHCNQCPTVSFNPNSGATVTKPSGKQEIFYWTSTNNQLSIYNIDRHNLTPTFPDTNYILNFSHSADYTEAGISHPRKKYTLTLRR